ncbi:hypothetical protein HD553DRAFT_311926 [Filobasidium floriforme]|uniref:uncharacterized protein n=1 Tax=Filobasidium floriforme TaxID=5210 RepID=UPI001E8D7F3E|nr:uncharacterized protein HD553DRAFT_311926 [Filobasidium floriforme]KAH8084034.1 hypothetical protein HD553DRAFT_311926 [Filobasidium floriforme]
MDMKVDNEVDGKIPTTAIPVYQAQDQDQDQDQHWTSDMTHPESTGVSASEGGSAGRDLGSDPEAKEGERYNGVETGDGGGGDADGNGRAGDTDADTDGRAGDIHDHHGLPPPPPPATTSARTSGTMTTSSGSPSSLLLPATLPNPDPASLTISTTTTANLNSGSSSDPNSSSNSNSRPRLGPAPGLGLGVPFELKVPNNIEEEDESELDSNSRSKSKSRARSGSRSPSASPSPTPSGSGSQSRSQEDDPTRSRSRSTSISRSPTPSPTLVARDDTRLQSDGRAAMSNTAGGAIAMPMNVEVEVPEDKNQESGEGQSGEPGQGVDMGRLMNSIEITKRATFLRQRLSSLGSRPTGFRPVSTSVEDRPDNPFSSPPSSPPLHTPQVNTNGLQWRERKVPASPASPSVGLKLQSEAWSREVPRTPITPGRKRKLDYESTPFRSPGDLMALTLESPGRKGRDDAGEELANEAGGSKRRGKTWVQVQPGSGSGVRLRSPARRSAADGADGGLKTGRRASMGTGPRLGIALPRRAVDGDKQASTQIQTAEQYPVQMQPRRVMGIEGYLADRYGDVMGGSRYPPPLPTPQASSSTSASSSALHRDADTEIKSGQGHKRRTSTGVVTSSTTAPSGSDNRYVSFMTGKKPRSASHSVLRRPVLPGNRTGEMTEAANVLTGMLGGSPLRQSTASPVRPERSSKPYTRSNGDELGFRVPSARTRSGSPGEQSPPPLLASGQITPPKQISRLPRVRHTDGAQARSGDDDDDQRAAELMIFLAQSPGSTAASGTARSKRSSFVQGAGIGRVLFDGDDVEMRDAGRQAVAGGEVIPEG